MPFASRLASRLAHRFPHRLPGAFSALCLLAAPALAQTPGYTPTSLAVDADVPRTPAGRPDLQGVVWATNFFPVFEASPMSATLVVSESEAKAIVDRMTAGFLASDDFNTQIDPEVQTLIGATDGLPLVRGERRARAVVLPADGRLPLTPEARAELRATDPMDKPANNPEERPSLERCLLMGGLPPLASTLATNYIRFIQTPGYVVVHAEYGDEARIIPLTDTHKPAPLRSRLGDSIARWDGDTLEIRTIGLPPEERIRAVPRLMVPASATVVERYTRVSPDELLYQFTVEDPSVYTAPWLAEHSLYAQDAQMYPHACHEGNYSLPLILSGQRVIDARKK
jgi:hypothetical protein